MNPFWINLSIAAIASLVIIVFYFAVQFYKLRKFPRKGYKMTWPDKKIDLKILDYQVKGWAQEREEQITLSIEVDPKEEGRVVELDESDRYVDTYPLGRILSHAGEGTTYRVVRGAASKALINFEQIMVSDEELPKAQEEEQQKIKNKNYPLNAYYQPGPTNGGDLIIHSITRKKDPFMVVSAPFLLEKDDQVQELVGKQKERVLLIKEKLDDLPGRRVRYRVAIQSE